MGLIKSKDNYDSEILELESLINNLWRELNTCALSHASRVLLEKKLGGCEEEFKAVLGGQASTAILHKHLTEIDQQLALAMITQAESEIPKSAQNDQTFLALETVRHDLDTHKLSPIRARYEVKQVMLRSSKS